MSIAVTTPTGNIGRALTDRLLKAGAEVTLLVRDPAKVSEFTARGAKALQGSLEDEAYLIEATAGTEALFWLTPPDYATDDLHAHQLKLGKVAAAAIRANKIPHVVNLSSVGAQHESGTGPIKGLHFVEKMLDEVATNIVHLRPAFFMENFLMHLETIGSMGSIFMPTGGDSRIPMVATDDISGEAAKRLLDRSWTGRIYQGVHGPANLTFDEAASGIGEALGREVNYVAVTPDQAKDAMMGMGLTADLTESYLEMYVGMGKGLLEPAESRSAETTTKTTIAEFARKMMGPALKG